MRFRTVRSLVKVTVLAAALPALVLACGDNDDKQGATATSPAAATQVGGPTTGPTQDYSIPLVARDNSFDSTTITVQSGREYTLTLANKGAAVHNWHVLGVKDRGGKEITTALLPAGQSETITFTIAAPGEDDYLCDVYPNEMRGRITVR